MNKAERGSREENTNNGRRGESRFSLRARSGVIKHGGLPINRTGRQGRKKIAIACD